jgi:hypothetical protein
MDNMFESKRQEMMRELSKRRRDNVVKRKVANMQKQSPNDQSSVSIVPSEKKRIAVYGADSFFIKNFIATLKLTNDVVYDSDVEKLIGMVMDSGILNIAVDMDPPTDWRMAVDVFTTIKTVNPTAVFYACTKDPSWVQARTIENQGALIIKKPVDFDHLYKIMK